MLSQDLSNPEARTSADHQSKRSAKYEKTRRTHFEETRKGKYEETRSGNIDYRIQGIPHSAVQKEQSNRRDIFKILIQHFEMHPKKDLNKTEEFNSFSEKSKQLITSTGNTEYFELCEI